MTDEEIEKVALQSALNMGPAKDIYHEDYGWVLKNGEVTEVGVEFFNKIYLKPTLWAKAKIFLLSLFLTGCASMPNDSFNNPIWDCTINYRSQKVNKVKVYAEDEYTAKNQALIATGFYYGGAVCEEEK